MQDTEEAVVPQNEELEQSPIDQLVEDAPEAAQEVDVDQLVETSESKTMVPLSVLAKERAKKKELELEIQWYKQKEAQAAAPAAPQEDDSSRYESATREDVRFSRAQTVRDVREELWMEKYPERAERVNSELKEFLKLKPNLRTAIAESTNRYEEAYTLMEALSPKQQKIIAKPAANVAKKEAPNAPGGVPKAAALNEAVDVMSMSDKEFSEWKASKKRRR
jgi:hypothetical protein